MDVEELGLDGDEGVRGFIINVGIDEATNRLLFLVFHDQHFDASGLVMLSAISLSMLDLVTPTALAPILTR